MESESPGDGTGVRSGERGERGLGGEEWRSSSSLGSTSEMIGTGGSLQLSLKRSRGGGDVIPWVG